MVEKGVKIVFFSKLATGLWPNWVGVSVQICRFCEKLEPDYSNVNELAKEFSVI